MIPKPIRKFIFPNYQILRTVGYEQYKEDPVKYSNYFPFVVIYEDNAIFYYRPNFGETVRKRYSSLAPHEFFCSDYYLYPQVDYYDVQLIYTLFGFVCKQGWDAPTCKQKFLKYVFEKYPEPCNPEIKRRLGGFIIDGHENGYDIPNPKTGDFIEILCHQQQRIFIGKTSVF